MSDRKLENNLLWIVCIVSLTSLITTILIVDISIIPKLSVDIPEIAALFTSFITLFTLFEIKKQRKKMYEPALAFGINNNSLKVAPGVTNLNVEIYNLGFGSAKNIKIEWDYYDKLVGIREVFPDLDNKFIEISNAAGKSINLISKENDRRQEIDYLLPVSVSPVPVHVRVPSIVTNYVIIRIDNIFKNDGNRDIIDDCYNLPFKVTYYDINKSKNVRRYSLKLGISMYNTELHEAMFNMEMIEI